MQKRTSALGKKKGEGSIDSEGKKTLTDTHSRPPEGEGWGWLRNQSWGEEGGRGRGKGGKKEGLRERGWLP